MFENNSKNILNSLRKLRLISIEGMALIFYVGFCNVFVFNWNILKTWQHKCYVKLGTITKLLARLQ